MDHKKLIDLGLTEPEAKIYVDLITNGSSLAGAIAKRTELNRTTTYDALERLKKKAFVTFTLIANRKVFSAQDPKAITNFLEEKQRKAQDIITELSSIQSPQKDLFHVYEGKKGIVSILEDILKYKEYVAHGSSGKLMEVLKHEFELFQRRKKELKIKSRIIQTEKNPALNKIAYASFRYLPAEHSSPVTTIIYGNKTVIIIWSSVPHAILIESTEVASQYKEQFENLWKIAK